MSDESNVTSLSQSGQEKLKAYVERIEKLEEEKKAIADDIKDVYDEAGATGFDKKIIREVVKLRKKSRQDREEEESIKELYLHALGEI